MVQRSEGVKIRARISKNYFSAHIETYDVFIFGQAPDWDVYESSPAKNLFCKTKLADWLKRGTPLRFLQLGSLPDWPTIPDGSTTIQNVAAERFALPYVAGKHTAVPLSKGRTGNLLSLTQFTDNPVGIIFSTFYQVPKVGGMPLSLHLLEVHDNSEKYNSLFLFSGAQKNARDPVQLEKIWLAPIAPLPSIAGQKDCKDSRALYVNEFDSQGMNDLMH